MNNQIRWAPLAFVRLILALAAGILTYLYVGETLPELLPWLLGGILVFLSRAADGTPCGAARWRLTDKGVKLERFAVLAEYRNQQVGAALLHQVLQDARAAHPEAALYLHAQLRAIPFYERHGFEKVGEQFSECDIEHFKMIWRGSL